MKVLVALVLSLCTSCCLSELFEGDIILDSKTREIVDGQTTFDAVKSETRKWTNARVPYVFSSNFDSSRRQAVQQAIAEYNTYTCIRFVPRNGERNYVKFIIGQGCYSYIGMTGGEQPISIGDGCQKKGIIMHEMMHASGFWHEQSRLDRDSYIRVFWENIDNGRKNHNFKKYTHGEADYYGEGYDYDSVMHYGNWAFSTNDEMTLQSVNDRDRILGQRDGFSQTDVRQLNKVYKCKGYENVKVPPPKGCIDRDSRCADWAKWGVCKTSKRYMLVNCCKSCKTGGTGTGTGTGTGSTCKDSNQYCPDWARDGYCSQSYVKRDCKKSCNAC